MRVWTRGLTLAVVVAAIVAMVAAYGGSSTLARPISVAAAAGAPSSAGGTLPTVAPGPSVATTSSASTTFVEFGPRSAAATPSTPVPAPNANGPGYICSSAPCPMGITDYGVNATTTEYSYKSLGDLSYWDSGAELGIGTQEGGGGCLDPYAEAGVCFTLQQNQVIQGLYSKGHLGEYWAQNIAEVAYDESCSAPCVPGTYSVTWLDNIWNFSYSGGVCPSDKDLGKGCIDPKTIVGNQAGDCAYTGGEPRFYYCEAATVYDIGLPFTVNAYTTVNTYHTSKANFVRFYGEITEGASAVYGLSYDLVKFVYGSAGRGSPSFLVKDALAPFGLPYDYEWVFGGPGDGSTNAVADYGDLQSFYCTSLAACDGPIGSYHTLTHAWSSGEDTSETISDVYVVPPFNQRDLASLLYASDDPDAVIW